MGILEVGTLVLLLATGLALAGLWLLKRGTIGRPRAKGVCWNCRFDLGSSRGVVARCPECGREVLDPGMRPRTGPADRARSIVLGLLCLVPVGSIVLGIVMRTIRFEQGPGMDSGVFSSAGNRALKFVKGGGSEPSLRRSLDDAAQELAVEAEHSFGHLGLGTPDFNRNTIRRGWSGEGTGRLAEALDHRSASQERYDALIDAWADAYERHPVVSSTQVDEMIASLLAGRWISGSSSSSSDYRLVHASPRELTPSQVDRLAEMILNVQGDPARGWNPLLGQGLEEGYARGVVSEAQIRRYLEQALDPKIVLREPPPIRSGDVVVFALDPGWRLGSSMPAFVRLRSAGPSSAGRVSGHIVAGAQTTPNSHSQQLYDGVLALPDRVGGYSFEFEVEVSFGPDVIDAYKASVNPWHHEHEEPIWKTIPGLTLTKRTVLTIETVQSDAARSAVGPSEVSPEELANSISLYVTCDSCPDGTLVYGSFSGHPGVDMAMDVYLRQDGREHPLGWIFWFRAGMWSTKVLGKVEGIEPSRPVDFIFRPNPGLVERAFWAPTLFEHEIVLENRRLGKGRLPRVLCAP